MLSHTFSMAERHFHYPFFNHTNRNRHRHLSSSRPIAWLVFLLAFVVHWLSFQSLKIALAPALLGTTYIFTPPHLFGRNWSHKQQNSHGDPF
jgi:hypothetical protein